MNILCRGALSVLEMVYLQDAALFPFTTWLAGEEFRSDYAHPRTIRCTINCLLGLQEVARHHPEHHFARQTDAMIERFLLLHEAEVTAPADLGLLLLLLSGSQCGDSTTRRVLDQVTALAFDERKVRALKVQDVSWLLWGSVAGARSHLPEADATAHRLFEVVSRQFLAPGAALPSQGTRRGRFGIVSFGACAYFLRVVHDYGRAFDNSLAAEMFHRGLLALLHAQGPYGEWPWLMSNVDGRPLDFYPVFSVHQNSMSVLFLAAAAADGTIDVEPAMLRSVGWVAGRNQLGVPMLQRDPFFIFRSFERKALLARPERFARALRVYSSRQPAHLAANEDLVINRESRSYELGWVLYTLSAMETVAGIDDPS